MVLVTRNLTTQWFHIGQDEKDLHLQNAEWYQTPDAVQGFSGIGTEIQSITINYECIIRLVRRWENTNVNVPCTIRQGYFPSFGLVGSRHTHGGMRLRVVKPDGSKLFSLWSVENVWDNLGPLIVPPGDGLMDFSGPGYGEWMNDAKFTGQSIITRGASQNVDDSLDALSTSNNLPIEVGGYMGFWGTTIFGITGAALHTDYGAFTMEMIFNK